MLCYRCGSFNPDGSASCKQCGQQFVDSKRLSQKGSGVELKVTPRLTRKTLESIGATLRIGELLADRYEIRDVVGVGPIGTVYRTRDTKSNLDVALKVISPTLLNDRDDRKHFISEIRTARKLSHPNIARIIDCNQVDETIFITTQLLEGLSLRKIIKLRKEKNQPFRLKEIEPIFSHLCQALGRAHKIMVHGNLKPENVIILPNTLMITDFGMFRALPQKNFVIAQMGFGNRGAYLAPEVRSRDTTIIIDNSADTYSLGVILCEMLTGKIYEGPQASIPALPDEIKTLLPFVSRTLRQNSSQRVQDVHEFFDELHEAFATLRPTTAPPRPAPGRAATPTPPELPSRRKKAELVGDEKPGVVTDVSSQPHEPRVSLAVSSGPVTIPPEQEPAPAEPKPPVVPDQPQSEQAPTPSPPLQPLPVEKEIPSQGPKPLVSEKQVARRSSAKTLLYILHGLIFIALGIGAFFIIDYIHHLQSQLKAAQQGIQSDEPSSNRDQLVPHHSSKEGIINNGNPKAHDVLQYAGFCSPDQELNCQATPWATGKERQRVDCEPSDTKSPGNHSAQAAHDKEPTVDGSGSNVPESESSHQASRREGTIGCIPGMVGIPAGKALLGSMVNDPLRNSSEETVHSVDMKSFCIDRYEYPNESGANPLVNLSYAQAEQLCAKRGKRLCTEEEWEYACKGGGSRNFPYGDHFESNTCNTKNEKGESRSIAPSGKHTKCISPFGVYDMSGNVIEWTSGYTAEGKTLKGGSFSRQTGIARCAARTAVTAISSYEDLGFRCCADSQ